MTPEDDVLVALAEQQAELSRLLAGLTTDQWSAGTRCVGWTVADVVLHLAQTNEMARGSLEDRLAEVTASLTRGTTGGFADVDEGAAAMVAAERGARPDVLCQRWDAGADELRKAFEVTDAHRRVTWVAGQLSARTLAATRLAETWIHTGDVAEAVGVVLAPGERLRHVARLAWRTLPYAFARAGRELAGPVSFELEGPAGGRWIFAPEEPPVTVVRGPGVELCLVAGRRLDPAATSLRAEGPDAAAVLSLIRTYA